MNIIEQIKSDLINNNPDTVIHSINETDLYCMIPEMGYPFEVHITVNSDNTITDRCDNWHHIFESYEAWKEHNLNLNLHT